MQSPRSARESAAIRRSSPGQRQYRAAGARRAPDAVSPGGAQPTSAALCWHGGENSVLGTIRCQVAKPTHSADRYLKAPRENPARRVRHRVQLRLERSSAGFRQRFPLSKVDAHHLSPWSRSTFSFGQGPSFLVCATPRLRCCSSQTRHPARNSQTQRARSYFAARTELFGYPSR